MTDTSSFRLCSRLRMNLPHPWGSWAEWCSGHWFTKFWLKDKKQKRLLQGKFGDDKKLSNSFPTCIQKPFVSLSLSLSFSLFSFSLSHQGNVLLWFLFPCCPLFGQEDVTRILLHICFQRQSLTSRTGHLSKDKSTGISVLLFSPFRLEGNHIFLGSSFLPRLGFTVTCSFFMQIKIPWRIDRRIGQRCSFPSGMSVACHAVSVRTHHTSRQGNQNHCRACKVPPHLILHSRSMPDAWTWTLADSELGRISMRNDLSRHTCASHILVCTFSLDVFTPEKSNTSLLKTQSSHFSVQTERLRILKTFFQFRDPLLGLFSTKLLLIAKPKNPDKLKRWRTSEVNQYFTSLFTGQKQQQGNSKTKKEISNKVAHLTHPTDTGSAIYNDEEDNVLDWKKHEKENLEVSILDSGVYLDKNNELHSSLRLAYSRRWKVEHLRKHNEILFMYSKSTVQYSFLDAVSGVLFSCVYVRTEESKDTEDDAKPNTTSIAPKIWPSLSNSALLMPRLWKTIGCKTVCFIVVFSVRDAKYIKVHTLLTHNDVQIDTKVVIAKPIHEKHINQNTTPPKKSFPFLLW